jgi:adenosylhomocysteine nucleosidase
MSIAGHGANLRNGKSDNNAKVLVCYAVKEEVGRLVRTHGGGCTVLVTGMGRRNAVESLNAELELENYRLVLTCGFAGGLNPSLKCGTVVFSEDPELAYSDRLIQFGAVPAKFHCAKRVAVTAAEKAALRGSTGADVVEMESSAIRILCRERQIPSATIRVILDTAQEDLPLDFNALMTSHDKVNYLKLIWSLLIKPHKLLPLYHFHNRANTAAEQLDKVVRELLRLRN